MVLFKYRASLYVSIAIFCNSDIATSFTSPPRWRSDCCGKKGINNYNNMGIKASIIPTTTTDNKVDHNSVKGSIRDGDDGTSSCSTLDVNNKISNASHIEHMKDKQRRKDKWRTILAEYKSQILDVSYLVPSVRGNTVMAASQYPQSFQVQQKATLMPGTHKHLGGAYDPTDGCIYGVPANARAVLCLYPIYKSDEPTDTSIIQGYQMTTIPLPVSIASCNYKWLRGIFAHGYLWAIPAWADCVLCVDVDAFWKRRPVSEQGIVQLLPLPSEHVVGMQWQWHGAGINQEKTAIYCIPSNAKHVLKVDLITKLTSLIPVAGYDPKDYPNFSIDTTNKWYGGIVGRDNCVYGIPYRTCAVLKIDCTKDTAILIGPDYGTTKYNWHGGIQVHGKIYAHPSHANTVLVIDTNPLVEPHGDTNTTTTSQCSEIPIVRTAYDTDPTPNYKWLGGSIGLDGNIYCPACDTSSVLKIDVTTNTCTTFGHTGTLKNKWQGGILGRDGCIYCIPASGLYVCRISTDPSITNGEKPIQLLGPLSAHKDKWQGGHVGKDGCLYFIPENGYRVLKVTPPEVPPMIIDGKLPDGDVKLELL
jgi:hypothetical protein